METARDCDYISDTEFEEVFGKIEHVLGQLVLMEAHPDKVGFEITTTLKHQNKSHIPIFSYSHILIFSYSQKTTALTPNVSCLRP